MDSTTIERLAKINVEDLLTSLGLENLTTGRHLLQWMFLPAGRKFAREVLFFDDGVAQLGLQGGSVRMLQSYISSLTILGKENVPVDGPLLVLANHPGMTDTVALFASLPRSDLKVVASERPFLHALPATSQHLIFVPNSNSHRLETLRSIATHLRSGGSVLTFPAGEIEPDPTCMPGAVASLENWSESIGFFSRLVPDVCILPAIVSGVIAAPSLRHPLTRLRRKQIDRERLAASLQIFMRTFFPKRWPIHVQVRFTPPVTAKQLTTSHEIDVITCALIDYIRPFLAGS